MAKQTHGMGIIQSVTERGVSRKWLGVFVIIKAFFWCLVFLSLIFVLLSVSFFFGLFCLFLLFSLYSIPVGLVKLRTARESCLIPCLSQLGSLFLRLFFLASGCLCFYLWLSLSRLPVMYFCSSPHAISKLINYNLVFQDRLFCLFFSLHVQFSFHLVCVTSFCLNVFFSLV